MRAPSAYTFPRSSMLRFSTPMSTGSANTLTITFLASDNKKLECKVKEGQNLLEIAHENDVELEGACEGSLACSTCHVIIDDSTFFDRMPVASDEENDMLDLAFGLTESSRLGCQVKMCKELDGMLVRIPSVTRNMAIDGYKAKHH